MSTSLPGQSITTVSIALFDSGVGGLAYVPAIRTLLPRARLLYLADNACFPYGERSDEEVVHIVNDRVGRIIAAIGPGIVVIACNTASVIVLDTLRERYPEVHFVGVVPAVKPAVSVSRSGRIGVLATNRTVSAAYLDSLVDRYARGLLVERIAGGEIVDFVESRLPYAGSEARRRIVQGAADQFRDASVDTVVLGCTHFLHLHHEISAALGSGIAVVDSRDGVARRVHYLVEHNAASAEACSETGDNLFFTTAPGGSYEWFATQFGFSFSGVLGQRTNPCR